MRILVWLALAVLVYLALRKQALRSRQSREQGPDVKQGSGEAMLPCAVCSVFIPESEAIVRHGQAFCCDDHANRGA